MPGSYYTDVERTIYLTYYILMEDIEKYNKKELENIARVFNISNFYIYTIFQA